MTLYFIICVAIGLGIAIIIECELMPTIRMYLYTLKAIFIIKRAARYQVTQEAKDELNKSAKDL